MRWKRAVTVLDIKARSLSEWNLQLESCCACAERRFACVFCLLGKCELCLICIGCVCVCVCGCAVVRCMYVYLEMGVSHMRKRTRDGIVEHIRHVLHPGQIFEERNEIDQLRVMRIVEPGRHGYSIGCVKNVAGR